jgi:nanoRNase/pAp phosphatase (c-di-AMP/oligoRNAs hydrolase)
VKKTRDKFEAIRSRLLYSGSLLIVMQDSPDPDAIGSAAAMRRLTMELGEKRCTLAHGGTIGRAENQELVRYLGLNFRQLEELDTASFDLVAMVDTQPGTGNNSLPDGRLPDIVIDHHPIHRQTRRCSFTDIRQRYGATATILWEYLQVAGVEAEAKLATAMLYGIRSDTQDLGRDAINADTKAYLSLYPMSNKRALSRIQHGRLPRDYFAAFHRALQNATIYGTSLISPLGAVNNAEMIAEVADLLLRDEEINWVMACGIHDGRLLFSLRTSDPLVDAGRIAKRVAGRLGTAGGHNSMAGGQIPLREGTKKQELELQLKITERFLRATKAQSQTPIGLIDKPTKQRNEYPIPNKEHPISK